MKHHIEENLCKRRLMVNWYLNSQHIHKRGLDGGLNPSAPFNAMNLSWHLTDILRGASAGEAMVGEWRLTWIGRNCNFEFCMWIFAYEYFSGCGSVFVWRYGLTGGWFGGGGEGGRPSVSATLTLCGNESCNEAASNLLLVQNISINIALSATEVNMLVSSFFIYLLSSALGLCGLTFILCGNESCNEAILTSMPETSTLIKASR